MKISLSVFLSLCLIGLQLIAVFIVVTSSYLTSERALLSHARDLLSDVAANTIQHSRGFLSPAKAAAELAKRLAEKEIVSSDNQEVLEKLLFQQLGLTPQFSGIFYGDEGGNFVFVRRTEEDAVLESKRIKETPGGRDVLVLKRDLDFEVLETRYDPNDTYDPRTRPWYRSAQAERT